MKPHIGKHLFRNKPPSHQGAGPLRVEVTEETDADGSRYYLARAVDLPGCISDGKTAEEAIAHLHDAADLYQSVPAKL